MNKNSHALKNSIVYGDHWVVNIVPTSNKVNRTDILYDYSSIGVFSPSGSKEVNLFNLYNILIYQTLFSIHFIKDNPKLASINFRKVKNNFWCQYI